MVLIDTTRETLPEQKATQGKDWGDEEVDDDNEVGDNDEEEEGDDDDEEGEEEMVMCRMMMITRILTMQKMKMVKMMMTFL